MTGYPSRCRRGITLTEILISIGILGVGMVSLATLFPLGLLRLRDATRNSRSTFLFRNAGSDIETRNLFDRNTFPFNIPFATSGLGYNNGTNSFDPWLQDGPGGGTALDYVNNTTTGPGLPVAYDPLWWSLAQQIPTRTNLTSRGFRFGAAQTDDLHHGTSEAAGLVNVSTYGLQRVTNIAPSNVDPTAFVSPDDVVLQTEGALTTPLPTQFTDGSGTADPMHIASVMGASPLVPDLSLGRVPGGSAIQNDFAYSYMFTGQQTDCNEYTVFDGSIVVHNNRPFALDANGPAGERVVEGIFGYGPGGTGFGVGGAFGYSTGNPRLVLLRWVNTEPDPEVAVGGWIADVTYEQLTATSVAKGTGQVYPMQRCYWYRVAKRSVPADDAVTGYRSMLVTLTAPVRAKTLLNSGVPISPVFTNAALICPSVVNVFPRIVYTRD